MGRIWYTGGGVTVIKGEEAYGEGKKEQRDI